MDEELDDARGAAVDTCQLATVRMLQKRYAESIELHTEARKTLQRLGEPRSVAIVWHQLGIVYQEAGQYEAAEAAYQESLKIKVQIGERWLEATTLNQLGSLYGRIERMEEAVRFLRQAADVFMQLRDLMNEGKARNNIAYGLVKLKRYADARVELERAIECNKPFGHVAEPWKTFNILARIERESGNDAAARQARHKAMQAYLAYRRAGGESRVPSGKLCAAVAQDPGAVAEQLANLQRETDLPAWQRALIPALRAVLAGSRDVRLADDPNLDYDDAVELLLLIESLDKAAGA